MTDAMSYVCPFCGTEVRVGDACRGCARRKKRPPAVVTEKPWRQDAGADGLDLPDEDFDYEDFVKREFGKAPHHRTGLKWYWWLLALVVLAAMILTLLAR